MIQDIKIDGIEIDPYWWHAYITENRNGDIIISNYISKIVVGMNSLGGSRFTYSNPEEEFTRGICTDKYGHRLVAYDTCINLLDEDGTFQKKIAEKYVRKILLQFVSGRQTKYKCREQSWHCESL